MPTRKITDATTEPVTVDEAKNHLRVEHNRDDARIAMFITAARQECEQLLGRTLISTTWELTRDRFDEAIRLEWPPIQSVTSIKYDDAAGIEQTLNSLDYVLDAASEPGYVVPEIDKEWPDTQDAINAVRVRYVAGYGAAAADVPAAVKAWILLRIQMLYQGCDTDEAAKMRHHPLLDGYVSISC
jgi:uncharacterized phiE125 gp8 family phage protein